MAFRHMLENVCELTGEKELNPSHLVWQVLGLFDFLSTMKPNTLSQCVLLVFIYSSETQRPRNEGNAE